MILRTQAHARAGLIGNPSDGYFGKTLSVLCRNFRAEAVCYETPSIQILPRNRDRMAYPSIDALVDDVKLHGYYGIVRLIKATIKRFRDYTQQAGLQLPDRNFTLEVESNIPLRVGLAGSSAIVTATMRALMAFYGVEIPKHYQPTLNLSVELEELKIGAGLQDRVVQVYEGAVFMDFDRMTLEKTGAGRYEPIDPDKLPPLFVAYHDHLSEGTEVTHNSLRSRWNDGEQAVHDAVKRWAQLAQQARDLIVAGKGQDIAPLMDENFDLRASLIPISEGNRRLITNARQHGCAAKFAGSGGAIIGCYDGDPQRLARMTAAYESFGARVFLPQIV